MQRTRINRIQRKRDLGCHLGDDARDASGEGFPKERTVRHRGNAEVLVADDPYGGVEQVAEDGRREAAVETQYAALPPDLSCNAEGVPTGGGERAGAGRGPRGLAAELKPCL